MKNVLLTYDVKDEFHTTSATSMQSLPHQL